MKSTNSAASITTATVPSPLPVVDNRTACATGETLLGPASTSTDIPSNHRRHTKAVISQHARDNKRMHVDEVGNQSDSSSNSNSSLVSSMRYNECHPRAAKKCGIGGCGGANATTRGSFVMLGSRTSLHLPPLNENSSLDATDSTLALNLRRATRSTSWTNQKILDTIDGLNTCAQDLDPCLALGVAPGGGSSAKKDSPRLSFEKFVVPKSISNLIMQSRSSGSVNPPTSAQNREHSSYNFLSGITEDEDEEQDDNSTKFSTYSASGGGGIRLTITPSPSSIPPPDEKRKHIVAGGEAVADDLLNTYDDSEDGTLGRRCRNGDINGMSLGIDMKKAMVQQDELGSEQVISTSSEMDSVLCAGIPFDKEENNESTYSLYGRKGKRERPSVHHHLHSVRFEDDDDDIPPPQ